MTYSKIIRSYRKKLGFTQKELAKTMNVSHITVCRWETNFETPNFQNWLVLQNLFGIREDNIQIALRKDNLIIVKEIKTLKPKPMNTACHEHFTWKKRRAKFLALKRQGVSTTNIAKIYGIARRVVSLELKKAERQLAVKRDGLSLAARRARRADFATLTRLGMSQINIAKMYGITRQAVNGALKKAVAEGEIVFNHVYPEV
jgi:transcriptional regulator with XRE-family HTH domain